ncbi:MAG: 5-hydroxyisourate hydrolase-like protein (transthyretin family) [Planctomycetota bacterium]|jgi:5-hydroxyisourate hydrolase-like protein (transthyretin family)
MQISPNARLQRYGRNAIVLMALIWSSIAATSQIRSHVETKDSYPGGNVWKSIDNTVKSVVLVTQVIDSKTGNPIAGATMSLVEEADFPLPGQFTSLRSATTDENGWVRIDLRDDPKFKFGWMYFDAPGYAPRAEMTQYAEFPMELHRGEDAAFRLIDRLGRPQSGVDVGLIIGCGHTPDVRNTITDGVGIGVFKDVNRIVEIADVWFTHPSFLAEYMEWSDIYFPEPRGEIEMDWAIGVKGRVVDPAGEPVVGALVGVTTCHRGPWTKTDENGDFQIPGVRADDQQVCVVLPDGKESYLLDHINIFPRPPSGVPCTIVLHPDGHVEKQAGKHQVALKVLDGTTPIMEVEIEFVRKKDGLTFRGETTKEGVASVMLTIEDRWTVIFRDAKLRWQDVERDLTADEIKSGSITLALKKNPVVTVRLETKVDRFPSAVSLVIEGRETSLLGQFEFQEDPTTNKPKLGHELFIGKILVPEKGIAAIRVDWQQDDEGYGSPFWIKSVERFPVPKERAAMSINAPDDVPFRIEKLLAPDGTDVKAEVSFLSRRAIDEIIDYGLYPEASTYERKFEYGLPVGPALWAFIKPISAQFEPLWIYIPKIRRSDPPIEAGILTFRKSDQLYVHVDLPNGTPARKALIRLGLKVDGQCDGEGDWWPENHTQSDLMGQWIGPITVEDERDDARIVPMRTKLIGKSPWTVQWPKGFVELAFTYPVEVDTEGKQFAPSITLFLNGHEFGFDLDSKKSTIRLEGIAPGNHRLVVSALGFLAHEIEFTMTPKGMKIPVTLTVR